MEIEKVNKKSTSDFISQPVTETSEISETRSFVDMDIDEKMDDKEYMSDLVPQLATDTIFYETDTLNTQSFVDIDVIQDEAHTSDLVPQSVNNTVLCETQIPTAGQKLQVIFDEEGKKMWLNGLFECFNNVFTLLAGPDSNDKTDSWEIPLEAIEELSYLGAGAQGMVFAGLLRGELVAIKKVQEERGINIKQLRKLNHENVVRFRGMYTKPPIFCIIMEYCQYGSLHDFLQSGSNLLPSQIMKWAKDITLGMAYLHAHKIVHRDLKSPNILIGDNMVAKVSDFGTSRESRSNSTLMSFKGTVAWMAPEIIRHEPCSEKIDVWSYGVVLWELMTREVPYREWETNAIIWGVGGDTLSLPIPTGCPNTIQIIICQCWQRIPKNRPPFKIIGAHIDMATPDIAAIDAATFASRQRAWGEEVRDSMSRIYTRRDVTLSADKAIKPESKAAYLKQICRANELFMEACTLRLQLEQRELAIAEREKLLNVCRCRKMNQIKMQRRQSSTSSDGKPIVKEQPRKKEQQSQLMVKYVEKGESFVYSVAIAGPCACVDASVLNNNVTINEQANVGAKDETVLEGEKKTVDAVEEPHIEAVIKKDTIIEQNGNVLQTVPVNKDKPVDNVQPAIAML